MKSAALPSSVEALRNGEGIASALSSSDQSRLLLATRPPRQVVSILTCSKLCGICFVAGVVVGYSLKRRVNRWVSKLLRRLKED
ncbi:uncharacterized protein LOC111458016 [Cucurbita moschata]|uniref:Uncharacterized protein LOC111458016 n=1 Tax=Cucurbita moschata TaxID=3662 RepID=A0A6J1GW53_CUCMO|nr:uncharacterized protein LOC111458016 [Cucurbita moschata]